MEHHNQINKNTQPSLTPKTVQTKGIYLQDNRPTSILQKKANNTGLPDNLKSGIENLSGHSMDDVKVHYNSDKPAHLNAHAYAQGSNIHLASGQEKHLPHEAWHVVQQKQGRVKPTTQMKGKVNVNDDTGLEKEADVMGEKAVFDQKPRPIQSKLIHKTTSATTQLYGDKIAATFEAVDEEILPIQEGLKNIYIKYRADKKQKRNKNEQDYLTGSKNLLKRQEYLNFRMRIKLYELANEKNKELKFSIDHAETESKKIDLPKDEKTRLNAEAVTLAKTQFKDIKTSMSNIAIELESQKLYDKRQEEIEIWKKDPKTEKEPNNKTINQSEKDAINNIKGRINSIAKAVAYHHLGDKLVQNHEARYMESAFKKSELMRLWKNYAQKQGYWFISDISQDDVINLHISKKRGGKRKMLKVATLYENDNRFIKTSEHQINDQMQQPEIREIFKNRENGKEYVKDAHDTFVKRFVSRALNKYDVTETDGVASIHINADPRTKTGTGKKWKEIAQDLAVKNDKRENMAEVFKHQRQKEAQGGSPFISLTTTEREIFGSTGMNFEGEHGKAVIDLGKISKNRIIDTHTPEAFKQITSVKHPDPYMPFSEDPLVEKNSATRDSVRTRELVLLGNTGIPPEAISEYRRKEGGRSDTAKPISYTKHDNQFYTSEAYAKKHREATPKAYQKWKNKRNWQKLLSLKMITSEAAATIQQEVLTRKAQKKQYYLDGRPGYERPGYIA